MKHILTRPTLLFFLFSALLVTILPLVFYKNLPPRLPLFYSLPWGESQLITKQQFFLLPAVLITVNLINFLIASQLHPLQMILKRIVTLSTILINLIIIITTLKILLIFL